MPQPADAPAAGAPPSWLGYIAADDVIAGIALEVGIEPSVRHGLDLNYVPVVVADACGSKTAQKKERSLATLDETSEIITINTAELASMLRSQ